MAGPTGQFRPWRLIGTFLAITAVLYGMVFLLPGSNSPKLGIDLQGGTRVTLQARTLDGSAPSRTSMNEARDIMERRVNGSGVVGAQVQLDGASQLVVTVPGQADLTDLVRPAQMNIRSVRGSAASAELVAAAGSTAAPTGTTPTSGATSGSGTPTSGAPTSGAPTSGASTSGAVASTAPATTGATATAAPASSAAGNGLRRPALAVATTESAAPESGATSSPAAMTPIAATDASEAPESGASSSPAPMTPIAATDATATGTGTAPAVTAAFPAGSDPVNPTQPLGAAEADWAAWYTAAETVVSTQAVSCADLAPFLGLDDPKRPLLACDTDGTQLYLLGPTIVPGSEIDSANAGISSSGAGWAVNVKFRSAGFSAWSAYTTANVGALTAFTLDGQVISSSSIREPITTVTTEVSGSFTQESSTALANSLKFGALPLAFDLEKTDTVSAELGLESLRAGLIAGGIGLLLVIIYCLIYYRLLGVITILSLVLSFGLVYAVMVLLGRWIDLSLDMAGIAGLIIAIGITADSFVIYFERLKDEVREGRTFRSAVPRGWERAKRTILSADAVTFLSAVILYILAVGDVKGFAFTLGLSTVLDLVVVFMVTHPLVHLAAGSKAFLSPKLSGLGAVADAGARQRAAQARLAAKEA